MSDTTSSSSQTTLPAPAVEPTRTLTPAQLRRMERRKSILEMRKAGKSIREIAEFHRLSLQTTWDYLHEAIAQLNRICQDTRDDLVRLEVERCESIFAALYPDRRVPRVAEVLLKVMDRKAKYLGLDAPLKLEQAITVDEMTPDQMQEEARRIGLGLGEFPSTPLALPGESPPAVVEPDSVEPASSVSSSTTSS